MIKLISYKYNGSFEYTAEDDLEIPELLKTGGNYITRFLVDNMRNKSKWYVSPNFYNQILENND